MQVILDYFTKDSSYYLNIITNEITSDTPNIEIIENNIKKVDVNTILETDINGYHTLLHLACRVPNPNIEIISLLLFQKDINLQYGYTINTLRHSHVVLYSPMVDIYNNNTLNSDSFNDILSLFLMFPKILNSNFVLNTTFNHWGDTNCDAFAYVLTGKYIITTKNILKFLLHYKKFDPFHFYLIFDKNYQTVSILKAFQALLKFNVNSNSNMGTCLHLLLKHPASQNNTEVFNYLATLGIDWNIRDTRGYTCTQVASRNLTFTNDQLKEIIEVCGASKTECLLSSMKCKYSNTCNINYLLRELIDDNCFEFIDKNYIKYLLHADFETLEIIMPYYTKDNFIKYLDGKLLKIYYEQIFYWYDGNYNILK